MRRRGERRPRQLGGGVDDFRRALVGGIALGAVATTIANLKEGFDEPEDGGGGLAAWLISLAILAVVSAIVWVVATRLRAGGSGEQPVAAIVFAVLSVLALGVFWAGVTGPLAGAAAGLVLGQGASRRRSGMATAALVVSGIAVVLMLVAAVSG